MNVLLSRLRFALAAIGRHYRWHAVGGIDHSRKFSECSMQKQSSSHFDEQLLHEKNDLFDEELE